MYIYTYIYIWVVAVLMPLKITQPNQPTTKNFSTSQLLQIPWDAALNPPRWRLSWDHPSGATPYNQLPGGLVRDAERMDMVPMLVIGGGWTHQHIWKNYAQVKIGIMKPQGYG